MSDSDDIYLDLRLVYVLSQVSMLLTGCVANDRLDHMTFVVCDAEIGYVIDDDDDDADDVWMDTTRKVVVSGGLAITRTW